MREIKSKGYYIYVYTYIYICMYLPYSAFFIYMTALEDKDLCSALKQKRQENQR